MVKLPKSWWLAAGSAVVLTLGFGLLALFLYNQAEAGVVRKHTTNQELNVQWAATALALRAETYGETAEDLAALLARAPEQKLRNTFDTLSLPAPASNLLLLESNGTLRFRHPVANSADVEAGVLPWPGARETVLSNPFQGADGESQLAILAPVVRDGRVVAQVGLVVPVGSVLEPLRPRGSSLPALSFSLLDEKGTVLAHTFHPEMVGRRIPAEGESCLPCHASFELERRRMAGERGAARLQVGREPLALVTYTPVVLLGRQWSLALSEPYSAVIADTRNGFRSIVILLGLWLLGGIVAVTLTLQHRGKRRRAEERARLAERRAALERRLRETEQLAAIGQMTSQIAHQVRTPLAALGLNVSYLQTEMARRLGGTNPEVEEVTRAIAAEIDRLNRVVSDYLRFSRVPQPLLETNSLRDSVEELVEFLEPEARQQGVQLETDLGQDPAPVALDSDLFRQAFLNLVRNSFEAMPGGGRLRVGLGRENSDVVLTMADTGVGIAPEVLPRIFEPFFTTKKDGTGLGLAHARRVIEQHGGTITCESAPGRGTTFLLRLPAAGNVAESESWKEISLAAKGH